MADKRDYYEVLGVDKNVSETDLEAENPIIKIGEEISSRYQSGG